LPTSLLLLLLVLLLLLLAILCINCPCGLLLLLHERLQIGRKWAPYITDQQWKSRTLKQN